MAKLMLFISIPFFSVLAPGYSAEIPFLQGSPVQTAGMSGLYSLTQGIAGDMHLDAGYDYDSIVPQDYAAGAASGNIDAILKNIFIAHMILSIITMTGYAANAVMGAFVISEKFLNEPYLTPLLYVHAAVGVTGALLTTSVISLGYATIFLKKANNIQPNDAYSVAVFVNTGLFAVQLGMVVANLATSLLNPDAAKWVGIAHAATSAAVLVGVAVQFGTSFIKK